MRNKLFVLIVATFLFSCAEKGDIDAADIIACGKDFDPETQICDKRDGKKYKIVRMPDNRYWMAENLNYEPLHGLSKCYRDEEENCKEYGRLYSWSMRGDICPDGWRVPYDEEWDKLEFHSGGDRKLKAREGWDPFGSNVGNGEDSYGFGAKPAGAYMIGHIEDGETCEERYDEDGALKLPEWNGLGEITIFISIGESADRAIANDIEGDFKFCWAENSLKSVRCIKKE
jgi:uncharacterized protein (TIGR02145 family)